MTHGTGVCILILHIKVSSVLIPCDTMRISITLCLPYFVLLFLCASHLLTSHYLSLKANLHEQLVGRPGVMQYRRARIGHVNTLMNQFVTTIVGGIGGAVILKP